MTERKFVNSIDEVTAIRCSMDEAETTVGWMRGDEAVHIFTSDNITLTKIKRAAAKNFSEWKCYEAGRDENGYAVGWNFIAPRKAIRFGSGAERSEEQKQAARDRAQARIAAGWLPGQIYGEDEDADES